MAKKKRKGFARPGSTVIRKVGKRLVRFKANSSSARIPGKLVPRAEKPNIGSNTIPGFKKKKKRKRKRKTVSRKRKSTTRRKRVVRRTRTRRRVGRPRKRTVRRSHKRKRRGGRRRRR